MVFLLFWFLEMGRVRSTYVHICFLPIILQIHMKMNDKKGKMIKKLWKSIQIQILLNPKLIKSASLHAYFKIDPLNLNNSTMWTQQKNTMWQIIIIMYARSERLLKYGFPLKITLKVIKIYTSNAITVDTHVWLIF